MKYEDKNKIDAELINLVTSAIHQSHIIDQISRITTAEYQEYLNKANAKLELYDSVFKKLALMYEIEYEESHYHDDITAMKKDFDKFIRKIESKIKTGTAPKQRILTYTINDEDGHTFVSTVKSKDTKYLDEVMSSHSYYEDYALYENIFDHSSGDSLGKIGTWILAKYNIEYNDKLDVRDALRKGNKKHDLHTDVKEYFKTLVKDESVSVVEFSEILAEIIPTGRHEGDYEWITF
jgi:hypothetical protein